VREIQASSNYLAMSDSLAHFGLGPGAGTIDKVSILWPSGVSEDFFDVSPNTRYLAVEGQGLIADFANDFDNDGDVDGDDLTDAVQGWQARFGSDLDGGNFLGWQRQFGSGVPALAAWQAVAEPNSFVLALVAAAAWMRRPCLSR